MTHEIQATAQGTQARMGSDEVCIHEAVPLDSNNSLLVFQLLKIHLAPWKGRWRGLLMEEKRSEGIDDSRRAASGVVCH